jgi:hypothetical protein
MIGDLESVMRWAYEGPSLNPTPNLAKVLASVITSGIQR